VPRVDLSWIYSGEKAVVELLSEDHPDIHICYQDGGG
jgi:hypothetical protein